MYYVLLKSFYLDIFYFNESWMNSNGLENKWKYIT